MKMRLLPLIVLMLLLTGCRKGLEVNYHTAENLNALSTEPGQPVMLGLYQRSGRPEGLAEQLPVAAPATRAHAATHSPRRSPRPAAHGRTTALPATTLPP